MASLMRITSRLADQCSGADISGDAMKLEKDLAEGSKKEIPLRPPCESKHHPSTVCASTSWLNAESHNQGSLPDA